ncbi:MAG: hypothetical protein EOP54_16255 [Sphingobacteriales bacterium]|nr:MAG: hypothetical protein EOP54_16255 [Sphingobacteriales bacterium]
MEDLLKEFTTSNRIQWKERLEKDLKGITVEQLKRTDDNHITINPFYTLEDQVPSVSVFTHTDWVIVAQVQVKDEKSANSQALSALQSGASGLHFLIEKESVNWPVLFEAIQLNFIQTRVEWAAGITIQETALTDYLATHNIDLQTVIHGRDNLNAYFTTKEISCKEALLSRTVFKEGIWVDSGIYYNAGVNSVSQLAYTLGHVQEALHTAAENGTIAGVRKININITVGTSFFEEISKLRALRQLVALLLQQYELSAEVQLYVQTGTLYKAPFDVYSNLLRDTLAGMAAVLGGCDALAVLPFDLKKQAAYTRFSQRMGINQQLLFKEESYLHQVADAAKGSYYIDQLTAQFSEAAWSSFQHIEKEGGLLAYFESGALLQAIAAQADVLVKAYVSGEKVWIGMNRYPNPTDLPYPTEVQVPSVPDTIRALEIAGFLNKK